MDYEKEYKDALKRAKEFMSVRGVSPYEDALECAKELSETIFPQLAESEDEKVRKELIKIVSKFQPEVWKELSETPQSVFIAWLEKQGEQKPAWSEEDEDMLYKATVVVNRLCAKGEEFVWSIDTLKKVFYWLKSLRPQNNWKPSDGQMKQLGWIAKQNKDSMIGKELMSLYQDLKKLREE